MSHYPEGGINLFELISRIRRNKISIWEIKLFSSTDKEEHLAFWFNKTEKSWMLNVQVELPELIEDLSFESQSLYIGATLEFFRIRLAQMCELIKIEPFGNHLYRTIVQGKEEEDWMGYAFGYYFPYKTIIQKDIYLLEAMIQDIFDLKVKVFKRNPKSWVQGPKLRQLTIGEKQLLGGGAISRKEDLVCCFEPTNDQEVVDFFPGGKGHDFLHRTIFPLFVNTEKYEPKIEIKASRENPAFVKSTRLNIGLAYNNGQL